MECLQSEKRISGCPHGHGRAQVAGGQSTGFAYGGRGAEPAVSSSASWPVAPLSRSRLTPWLLSRAPAGLGGRGMLRMMIFLVTNNSADYCEETGVLALELRAEIERVA
jgi:hypothetical protein